LESDVARDPALRDPPRPRERVDVTLARAHRAWASTARFAGAGCIVLSVGFLVADSRAARGAVPPLSSVDIGVVDVGALVGEQEAEGELRFTNATGTDWQVTNVSKECGCTTILGASDTVHAGEPFVLRVGIDSHGQAPERLERKVFATVEPAHAVLVARVRALLLPAFVAEPPALTRELDSRQTEFECRALLAWPAQSAAPSVLDDAGLELTFEHEEIRDAVTRTCELRARGRFPSNERAFEGTVRLAVAAQGDVPGQELEIRVALRKRPPFVTVPSRLVVIGAAGDLDGPVEAQLRVHAAPEDWSGLCASLVPAGLGVARMDVDRGQIELRLDRAVLTRTADARLRIQHVDGRFSEVPIASLILPER